MTTRRTVWVLIAVAVSVVARAPVRWAALPDDAGLDPLPVQGVVLPAGNFVGTLRIVAYTLDAAGPAPPDRGAHRHGRPPYQGQDPGHAAAVHGTGDPA